LTLDFPEEYQEKEKINWFKVYYWISGCLTFLISWGYAVAAWGFFLGLAFGWLPAILLAFIVPILILIALPFVIIGVFLILIFSRF